MISSAIDTSVNIKSIVDIEKKEVQFACESWLPFARNTVSMVVADGGVGKSWTVLQVAIRHLMDNPNERVFAWMSEDSESESRRRAELICKEIVKKDINNFSNLFISDNEPFHIIESSGDISKKFNLLKEQLKEFDLIIYDPLIGFYSGNENDNSQARKFMQLFINWAKKEDKTIVFIHHSSKAIKGSRGASSLVDAVRLVYVIENIEDSAIDKKITIVKDNYGVSELLGYKEFEKQILPSSSIKKRKNRKR